MQFDTHLPFKIISPLFQKTIYEVNIFYGYVIDPFRQIELLKSTFIQIKPDRWRWTAMITEQEQKQKCESEWGRQTERSGREWVSCAANVILRETREPVAMPTQMGHRISMQTSAAGLSTSDSAVQAMTPCICILRKINVYMKHTLLFKIPTPQGYHCSVRCSAHWVRSRLPVSY